MLEICPVAAIHGDAFFPVSEADPVHRNANGFTLIELMVAVLIAGILTVIALPSYTGYMQRAHRAEARNALLALAQRMEQNYTITASYAKTQDGTDIDDSTITAWGMDSSPSSGAARYQLSFRVDSVTATTFTVQAVPAGTQTNDTCGTLALNERNLKAANGNDPNGSGVARSATTRECWSH